MLEEFDDDDEDEDAASSVLASEAAATFAAASFFACLACLCSTPRAFLASTPDLVWSRWRGARTAARPAAAALRALMYFACDTAIFPFRISSVCSICMPACASAALLLCSVTLRQR